MVIDPVYKYTGRSAHNVINQSNLILLSLSSCNKLCISIDKTCYSLFGASRKCCDCSCLLVINGCLLYTSPSPRD